MTETRESMNFEQDVIQRSHEVPVLVDFWAPWCAPCRTLGPILDEVAEAYAGRLELVKLNTEEQPELANAFGIRGIPHCKLFSGGRIVGEFSGALPRPAVEDWLDKHLPSIFEGVLGKADECLAAGDLAAVKALLEPILQAEPENSRAILLSAKARLWSAPAAAAELLGGVPVNADAAQEAEQLKELAEQLSAPAEPAEEGAAAHYEAALALLRQEQVDQAVEELLQSLRTDRHYRDDAARKAMLSLMVYFSAQPEKVADLRRRLGGVLFR